MCLEGSSLLDLITVLVPVRNTKVQDYKTPATGVRVDQEGGARVDNVGGDWSGWNR